jgi:hypothetical protein
MSEKKTDTERLMEGLLKPREEKAEPKPEKPLPRAGQAFLESLKEEQ